MTDKKPTTNNNATQPKPRRPDELGSVWLQAHLRITDPKTGQVIVEKSA